MSAIATDAAVHNGSDPVGGAVDLHLVSNGRWSALDLDELLEQLAFAGYPSELICVYKDPSGRRRYVRRTLPRARTG